MKSAKVLHHRINKIYEKVLCGAAAKNPVCVQTEERCDPASYKDNKLNNRLMNTGVSPVVQSKLESIKDMRHI